MKTMFTQENTDGEFAGKLPKLEYLVINKWDLTAESYLWPKA